MLKFEKLGILYLQWMHTKNEPLTTVGGAEGTNVNCNDGGLLGWDGGDIVGLFNWSIFLSVSPFASGDGVGATEVTSLPVGGCDERPCERPTGDPVDSLFVGVWDEKVTGDIVVGGSLFVGASVSLIGSTSEFEQGNNQNCWVKLNGELELTTKTG